MTSIKGRKRASHWREYAREQRLSSGGTRNLPIVYHYDGEGNYDAYVQPNPSNFDLWETWIGRPGTLVDDKIATKEEAIALAEQILGGE